MLIEIFIINWVIFFFRHACICLYLSLLRKSSILLSVFLAQYFFFTTGTKWLATPVSIPDNNERIMLGCMWPSSRCVGRCWWNFLPHLYDIISSNRYKNPSLQRKRGQSHWSSVLVQAVLKDQLFLPKYQRCSVWLVYAFFCWCWGVLCWPTQQVSLITPYYILRSAQDFVLSYLMLVCNPHRWTDPQEFPYLHNLKKI